MDMLCVCVCVCVWVRELCPMSNVCVCCCSQAQGVVHTLGPGETVFYTWERPGDRRMLRWGLAGLRVKEARHIYTDKASNCHCI